MKVGQTLEISATGCVTSMISAGKEKYFGVSVVEEVGRKEGMEKNKQKNKQWPTTVGPGSHRG